MKLSRREMVAGLSISSLAVLMKEASANTPHEPQDPAAKGVGDVPPAYRGNRPIVPLPFDPKQLRGISEKLITSHHENNYGGALKNLNKVEAALAQVTKETPAFSVAGLKERHLTFSNSVTLHELYFANLGGDGKPDGTIAKALGETWGSAGRWEEEFRATGASLAGGSGWTLLDLDVLTGALRIHWSGGHTQSQASSVPLLVMDMYEHAFHLDYGAAAAKYVDAFFANVQWAEVERRFTRAMKACEALRA